MHPALVEDHLAEVEARQQEAPPDEDGLYLVVDEHRIIKHEQRRPPSLERIKRHLGIVNSSNAENAPFIAMPGIVYWVYEEWRRLAGFQKVQILYEEHGELFIQEEPTGVVVITRVDKLGRIRLLSRDDARRLESFLRVS